MAQTDIQIRVNELINEFFEDIISNSKFEENELAYLTLQSKNEVQIRDRFAWWLQKELNKVSYLGLLGYDSGFEEYVVRREFSPEGRSKVDLAILEIDKEKEDAWDKELKEPKSKITVMNKSKEMKTYKVIAMIEFKAHSFVDDEDWIYPEFDIDVKKMCGFVDVLRLNNHKEDPDLYYIFLHGTQDHKSIGHNYKVAVNYKDLLEQDNTLTYNDSNLKNKIKNQWGLFYNLPYPENESFSEANGFSKYGDVQRVEFSENSTCNLSCPEPKLQEIGSTFGYTLYCAPMIWGPVKASDINILDYNNIGSQSNTDSLSSKIKQLSKLEKKLRNLKQEKAKNKTIFKIEQLKEEIKGIINREE